MTKPLISILLCTYNSSLFITETLQSCLGQSYNNIELLLYDDQSTDDTLSKLWLFTDHRIRVFSSEKKLWPYWWLNLLLDQAQGEYIAVQDHDDLWHSDKLARQIEFLSSHPEYIWCGTKTLMRYEWDARWFEYFLWNDNYYTIHPSLVFRNSSSFRYNIDSVYMQDAVFQKNVLCQWKKLIANLDETLTLHVVKAWAKNYSYKRFTYSFPTIRTVFLLHPVWYGVCILWFETLRKILYPILQFLWKWVWIDSIERLPFVLLGRTIETYDEERRNKMGFG